MSAEESARRLLKRSKPGRPAMLNRVSNVWKDDATGEKYVTSGPALILRVRYPDGVKPSDVLRAIAREAKRRRINLMPVEFAAGHYDGAGNLKGKPLPSAYQAVGADERTGWDDVKAFASEFWAFYDYGTDRGPTLPLSMRPPRGTRNEVDAHATIGGEGMSRRVADSIRNRVRPKDEREARERRAELNRVPEANKRSIYHADFMRWVVRIADEFVLTCTETTDLPQELVDAIHAAAVKYVRRYREKPASLESLQAASL
jgi:hypothetical protein